MAEELQVIVTQEPGTVTWNYDQLKESLAVMMQTYENMVYTEGSLVSAKQDLADLRKLRGVVEDRRKEIRNKCLEPYAVIEKQAKELTALIDKPIAAIDEQVKAYEAARRKERKEAILEYMGKEFAELPTDIARKLASKVYDTRWENASTAKKVWMDAITAARNQTASELQILSDVDEDFRATAMQIYHENLVLTDALSKVNELQKQREYIRQREQQRQAELERQKAERERIEAERRAKELAETKAAAQAPVQAPDAAPKPPEKPAPAPAKENLPDGLAEKVVRIRGNEKQIAKILAYIKFAGAIYEEVET